MKTIPVLVTTEYRGVFFGQLDEKVYNDRPTVVELSEARNVIYWSSETNGFLGLTSKGPAEGSRVSAVAGGPIIVHKVTSITKCSPVAAEKFQTWKS